MTSAAGSARAAHLCLSGRRSAAAGSGRAYLGQPGRRSCHYRHGTVVFVAASGATRPLEVVITGGGIGGLTLALALKARGMRVQVLERDLTAIRGEGKYRGPIQIQSNALAALEAIAPEVAEQVKAAGTVTGDRINGLVDGVSGAWYCKFDTFSPAVRQGLPITRVISRMDLQGILAAAVGSDLIRNGVSVVGFEEMAGGKRVAALHADGSRTEGDVLIAADGIWSKLRRSLLGDASADAITYSAYTCYTGIADFTPPDLDTVGYRVFLGNRQYFVSSDVGHGKMQWYGFHNEPAGGTDEPGQRKARLMSIFGTWCDAVTDLIEATPEEDVLRRDIYDRPPILTWARGRVALLGDSAHAMQPNLGQGGCMAIEDGHYLGSLLVQRLDAVGGDPDALDMPRLLKDYEAARRLRCGAIHGMAGMAAIMASTYKSYLGEGLGPLGAALERLQVPHPGRVGGYFAMKASMPAVLEWVLGGNKDVLAAERVGRCSLEERPRGFTQEAFQRFLYDDDYLLSASRAVLTLQPHGAAAGLQHPLSVFRSALVAGSSPTADNGAAGAMVSAAGVSASHARFEDEDGLWYVTDLGSEAGTWLAAPARQSVALTWHRLPPNTRRRLRAGDFVALGDRERTVFRVKNGVRQEDVRVSGARGGADAAATMAVAK